MIMYCVYRSERRENQLGKRIRSIDGSFDNYWLRRYNYATNSSSFLQIYFFWSQTYYTDQYRVFKKTCLICRYYSFFNILIIIIINLYTPSPFKTISCHTCASSVVCEVPIYMFNIE